MSPTHTLPKQGSVKSDRKKALFVNESNITLYYNTEFPDKIQVK